MNNPFKRNPVKRFLKAQAALVAHAAESGAGPNTTSPAPSEPGVDSPIDWTTMEMGRSELENFANATERYYEDSAYLGPLTGPVLAKSISEQYDLFLTAMKACRDRGDAPMEVERVRWANMGVDIESITITLATYTQWLVHRSTITDPFDLAVTVGLEGFMHGLLLGREVPA